jgi:hypothetical protein
MGPVLDEALKNPPAGVQVWSACMAGQHSYEGYLNVPGGALVHGGFFLSELFEAVGPYSKKHVNLGIQKPDDPLPMEFLALGRDQVRGVNAGTEKEVDELYKEKQTPRLAGREVPGGAAYDAHEPAPQAPVVRMPEAPAGGAASPELVAGILREIDTLPPVKIPAQGIEPLKPEALPPFAAKTLERYRDDGKQTPLRDAVIKAIRLLEEPRMTKAFQERFPIRGSDANTKAMILKQQREPAIIQADLEEALQELLEAGKQRDQDPSPRWQANYDYVLARLEARIAYVYEYNYMLGQIRKDALPKRDPAVHTVWQLASQEKLQSGSEARKHAADAKKRLAKVAKEHRGTPWEVLAKRDTLAVLGLEWKPTR